MQGSSKYFTLCSYVGFTKGMQEKLICSTARFIFRNFIGSWALNIYLSASKNILCRCVLYICNHTSLGEHPQLFPNEIRDKAKNFSLRTSDFLPLHRHMIVGLHNGNSNLLLIFTDQSKLWFDGGFYTANFYLMKTTGTGLRFMMTP